MEIFKEFRFEAAHSLPKVPPGHPCSRIHGHSWRAQIHAQGDVGEESGWVIDFSELETAFESLHKELDHNYLNEVPGLSNPTSENVALWIWDRMQVSVPGLVKVVVRETCTSAAIYRGEHR